MGAVRNDESTDHHRLHGVSDGDSVGSVHQWAVVDGFDKYEVCNTGRVRRIGSLAELAIKPVDGGYRGVQMWKDGRNCGKLIHVLVARAFIGPCPPGMEVNHDDGDKTNNTVGNLEYMTRSDNMKHAYRTGLRVPTVAASAAARRKPREQIPCHCGCGTVITSVDKKGRNRTHARGHSG